MKSPWTFFWTCAVSASALLARAEAQQPALEPEKPTFSAARSGCTWKIENENSTIYLAGSVHLLREQDYPLPKVLDVAYENSDRLVFELDMAEISEPAGIAKMQALGMLPAGKTLSGFYSEKTWESLTSYFMANGLPVAMLERLTPGMAFLSVSSIEAMKLGAKPELGVETQFYQRSVIDGKPSSGLETAEFQMSRFDELTPEEHDELVRETLKKLHELPDQIDQIIKAWQASDIGELDRLLNEDLQPGDRLHELLLIERNANWIPQIEAAIAGDEDVMFIVGAAHLIGKKSVIELLVQRGHEPTLVEGWE